MPCAKPIEISVSFTTLTSELYCYCVEVARHVLVIKVSKNAQNIITYTTYKRAHLADRADLVLSDRPSVRVSVCHTLMSA